MSNLKKTTIGGLLDEMAEKFPEHDALVYPDRDLYYSYRGFQTACNQAAKGLLQMGIRKGDHVAIWATNYPEWVITQFATAKIGAVLVTVNTNYRSFELEYLLKHSDTTTLIMIDGHRDGDYVDMINELCPELKHSMPGHLKSNRLPFLKNVIYIGDRRPSGMYGWQDMMKMGCSVEDEILQEREKSLHPDDVINMQYTSGTTGFPKGVMLTHFNIVADATYIAECMDLTHQDRMCIPVPFFHCFGCVLGTLCCVSKGATMVPVQQFNALEVLKACEKEKCTAVHGVPTMFISELSHPEFEQFDLSHLRTGIMAGSTCPEKVMKEVIERMGMKEITIAYGQTEASPVITQTRTHDKFEYRVSSVGRALPNVEVKIVDVETGQEVPCGVQGELCARGFNIMKGYYKMKEATAQAIDSEGWLHTGDLAVMDEKGYCKITGRSKDMIIRGGENIYPREIEEFIYTHPKVMDVQVVGVPSEKYGEEVMAWIKVKKGETLTEADVKEYCKGKISYFKIPKYIAFVEAFPMTASAKIQKYKLREMGIELLGLEGEKNVETA